MLYHISQCCILCCSGWEKRYQSNSRQKSAQMREGHGRKAKFGCLSAPTMLHCKTSWKHPWKPYLERLKIVNWSPSEKTTWQGRNQERQLQEFWSFKGCRCWWLPDLAVCSSSVNERPMTNQEALPCCFQVTQCHLVSTKRYSNSATWDMCVSVKLELPAPNCI